MRTRSGQVAVDLPLLSTIYGVPEPELQTLLDAPTSDLINDFLSSLTAKGQEYDALKGEKLKVDVELENVVRTSETKVKAQKAAVTKHAKEIEELRVKLNEAESAREARSSELDQLRSSTSGSTAETTTLRQRIETLEASNRDALALVENKSTEKDRVATELSEQHGKLLAFRREVSQLEERNQALENAASSQKFKEQSLQQEIDLAKRNNEWHANELQTRNQEHGKFRKERNARIASLQRELEDSNANVDTLKRTESSLRQRLDEVQAKADEAFARIASLEEESTRKEQGWRLELDGSKRLAELQAQNAATHKARLQEIQGQVDQMKEDAANEIGQLQSEVETERADKEAAESKVADLELKVEQLEQQPPASRPATPMNGSFSTATPGRVGSPFPVPGSARKYGNGMPFTNTQYVARMNELEQDLAAERRRTQKLSTAMDEMVTEVESRGPELLELKHEQDRLEEELLNYSRLLEDANGNRDNAAKEAEYYQGEAESRAREGDILRQQLRDLSAQVKILMVEIQSRDTDLGAMTGKEKYELERAARGELEDWAQNESFTNQFISTRLVIFRNVTELQQRNEEQLKVLRELGERMEGAEARKKAEESEANAQEAEQLRQQVARYKDELQATATQIDSYIKERDMFRRMLHHRGQLAPDSDLQAMFGQSIPPATPQRNGTDQVAQTPRSKDVDDLNKLLREQQTFFDQFRNETSGNQSRLQSQLDTLGREKSQLLADVAHWKSQKTLAEERLQMLQNNFGGLRNENAELQKRSQQMAENAAKQDLRTQQVAEELIEARSMADSLRNENANAKAEKELWKRIESRYTDENKGLMDDRSRLNKLVTDLQHMANEREKTDSESRLRLQGRADELESELAETKKKLDQEVEDSRKATLRREYEDGQSRTRIDDLVKSLGNVREELVGAKTTRDQLQTRVDEMKIELRSAEERVAALQPRPTPRPQPQQNGESQSNDDEELPAEQRLALEMSELRRDLELAKNELESARQQVETYRGIAQSTEEELASYNETSEQYKEEVDQQIAEKDTRLNALQQRVDDLLAELTTTNSELSELRSKHDDSSRILNEQKATFEADLSRYKDDAERYAEEKKLYQEDIKAQAAIAQQAQQSYEDELQKHAEAARNLQTARKEHNELRTQVAGIRAEAEAAKASLERGEESWAEQKERFENELGEGQRRRLDVDEQNKRLHQQMEAFSSELAALRSGRNVAASDGEERVGTPQGDGNMQEVIKYLRREKEIVDVQYELSMQEGKRLQQQLEYANNQLEETRQKLAEERRQSADKTANEGSTNKLMQTINELNLFRESSITLRNEARQAREKLEEKSKENERLFAEIDPLKSRVGELEGDLEGKNGEIKLLQDDRDHWRERTQNIISKYDRVDPAELEEIKKQLADLKAEKERLEAEQAPLREQVEGMQAKIDETVADEVKPYVTKLDSFRNQAKEQNRKQVARIKEMETAAETASAEKTKLEEELAGVKAELEIAKTALQEAQEKAAASAGGEAEEGQVDESVDAAAKEKLVEAEKNAIEQSDRAAALDTEVQTLRTRVQELESQAQTLQSSLDNALQGGEDGEIQQSASADSQLLDKLRQDLTTAQQEVETLRANANTTTTAEQPPANDEAAPGEKSVADQVAEQVAKLRAEMEQSHAEQIKTMETERDRRVEAMKNQLSQKLKEGREKLKQEVAEEHSAELQKLRDEHDTAITKLKEAHQAEMEKLGKDGSAATRISEEQPVKTEASNEAIAAEWPTEEQMLHLMKTNQRVKGIFVNNINKKVLSETEKLQKAIAEKDEEIAKLKNTQANTATTATDDEKGELRKKLETAEAEKKEAVRLAVENESKKIKVQISQRDIAQAKIAVVSKAAQETPEKAVKEVWDVAVKAKPMPRPVAPSAAGGSGTASPASAVPKPNATASPAQAQGSPAAPAAQTQTQPTIPTQDLTEQEKILERQRRFGTTAPTTTPASFGQPSASSTGSQAPSGTFSQPSQGALGQPARRPSSTNLAGSNPQAQTFTPGAGAPQRTLSQSGRGGGIPQPRGGIAGAARGGATTTTGTGQFQIQGAAAAPRGGAQSSLPRGGGAPARGGRGGASGIPQRGGAGQKRPAEGGEGGGDGKRQRGGGGPGGAAGE